VEPKSIQRGVLLALSVIGIFLSLAGCFPPAKPPPVLFAVNYGGNSASTFVDPAKLSGDVPAATNLVGAKTQLLYPIDVAVNAAGRLLVCNNGGAMGAGSAILVYDDAINATGDRVPVGNVSGAQTMIHAPVSLAVDASRDLLYLANFGSNTILVFAGTSRSTFNGNVAPTRVFSSTSPINPSAIRLDGADNLYVANLSPANIQIFAHASTLMGSTSPRIVTNAQLFNLSGVFVDGKDRLFVLSLNAGSYQLLTFRGASTLNGVVTYDTSLTLQGAKAADGIVVDAEDTGYISNNDGNAILVYEKISTRNGTAVPDRTIQGPKTGLSEPAGLFLLER
jgi:sugar lactone lactonase YvrE